MACRGVQRRHYQLFLFKLQDGCRICLFPAWSVILYDFKQFQRIFLVHFLFLVEDKGTTNYNSDRRSVLERAEDNFWEICSGLLASRLSSQLS